MSTPERPSLADTLAHIDAVLDAYYDPTTNTRPEPAWGWFGRLLNRLIP